MRARRQGKSGENSLPVTSAFVRAFGGIEGGRSRPGASARGRVPPYL